MSGNHADRSVQDYLDDRLSADARACFEERLEREPELARRVERLREIGRALREDDEEPGPGFYTRARGRFEEATARKRRRGFRLLSWEAAGLATAVLLVAVVFVPGLIRDGGAPGLEAFPAATEGEDLALAATEDEDLALPVIENDRVDRVYLPPPTETKKEKRAAVAEEPRLGASQRDQSHASSPGTASQREEAPVSAELEDVRTVPSADAMPRAERPPTTAAPEPTDAPLSAGAVEESEEPRAVMDFNEEGAARRREKSSRRAPAPQAKMAFAPAPAPGFPLPVGLVEPGTLERIGTPARWEEVRATLAGEDSVELPRFDDDSLLLLVGPDRIAIDCAGAAVERTADGTRLRLGAATRTEETAPGGCAVIVERRLEPLEVWLPSGDRRRVGGP